MKQTEILPDANHKFWQAATKKKSQEGMYVDPQRYYARILLTMPPHRVADIFGRSTILLKRRSRDSPSAKERSNRFFSSKEAGQPVTAAESKAEHTKKRPTTNL